MLNNRRGSPSGNQFMNKIPPTDSPSWLKTGGRPKTSGRKKQKPLPPEKGRWIQDADGRWVWETEGENGEKEIHVPTESSSRTPASSRRYTSPETPKRDATEPKEGHRHQSSQTVEKVKEKWKFYFEMAEELSGKMGPERFETDFKEKCLTVYKFYTDGDLPEMPFIGEKSEEEVALEQRFLELKIQVEKEKMAEKTRPAFRSHE